MAEERTARLIDIAFSVEGRTLPRDHRHALAEAIERLLPWLAGTAGAGVHPLKLVAGTESELMVSPRTRLALRVPIEREQDTRALGGAELDVAGRRLRLGAARRRELLRHRTLYAHLVAAQGDDESGFLRSVEAELRTLGVQCRPICGRHQVREGDRLQGFSLMLDGLSPDDSLRVLEAGVGPHRRLGCGLFVAHRSAAAVGADR